MIAILNAMHLKRDENEFAPSAQPCFCAERFRTDYRYLGSFLSIRIIMKQKHLLFAITVSCLTVLSACEHPTGSGQGFPDIAPSPARPALTYYGAFTKGASSYSAIYVMDSDGAHPTPIQIAGDTSVTYGSSPSWSPTGTAICFTQGGTSTVPDSIKAIDVSVATSLTPLGSNLRTIFGLPNTSIRMKNPFWSSTTAMGMIAYATNEGASESVWVVPQSGGMPMKIFSVDTSWVHNPNPLGYCTWSPDDSRLAVCRFSSGANPTTIMIFNTSTWAYVDSIPLTGWVVGLDWSRNGLNKLAFGMAPSSSDPYYLYYCDPTTAATPVTNGVVGSLPTWSPDNSIIVYFIDESSVLEAGVKSFGVYRVTSFTPFITEVSPMNTSVKWKR